MELTIETITKLTGGKMLQTGSSTTFQGVASLDEAQKTDISFLGNEKYYNDYLATEAGIVLVPPIVDTYPEGVGIVEVENPSLAFGEVMKKLAADSRPFTAGIHPSAIIAEDVTLDPSKVSIKAGVIIESGAFIGDHTEIGPGAVIGENVKIGDACLIYANVTIRENCQLGNRVILQPGCVIGADGYGYEFVDGKHLKIDQVGIVTIADDVEIGANSTIDRARFGKTSIGEGTKIDNLVQIAHNVKIGKHCLVVAQTGIAGSAEFGDYVTCAAQSGIAGHLKVGDKATLMGRTGVMKSLDGDQVYWGLPARPAKEEQKKQAALSRLPSLIKEVKSIRQKLDKID
ncbi:UDP-3-O-(3-hydroxymyristoyl)glucosamine N-acyltransferase [Rubritalea tangerina]|uniref:UDP-3-O-acylglucosamine N-acyltransferase n=1 Tax=Rubritalea tangerina TaxID=430798 RepID=A0ABW4Z8F8_9BACT